MVHTAFSIKLGDERLNVSSPACPPCLGQAHMSVSCRVQIKTIFILWIVVLLQMMLEQQGIAPLNQLTNSLRHHFTDWIFANYELFSASVHLPLNRSEMSLLNMLYQTWIFYMAEQLCRRLVGSNNHCIMESHGLLWFACNWGSLIFLWLDWSHHAFHGTQAE